MTADLSPQGVYTVKELMAILKVSRTTLYKLDFPCIYFGARSKRYLGKQVLEVLEGRAA